VRYQNLNAEIASAFPTVTLIAVSKNRSVEQMMELYRQGCRDFGESRIQEALDKMEKMPTDIRWHLIGTLQKNKVRKAIGKFALVHSVDTPELARKISECSSEAGLTTQILLQANTSGEPSKHGLSPYQWNEAYPKLLKLPNLKIEGLMTMAPLVDDQQLIRRCFSNLRLLRDQLGGSPALPILSMGMSHDYRIALEEGATHLRVGTAIFAE
jgi:PLP dependent protein